MASASKSERMKKTHDCGPGDEGECQGAESGPPSRNGRSIASTARRKSERQGAAIAARASYGTRSLKLVAARKCAHFVVSGQINRQPVLVGPVHHLRLCHPSVAVCRQSPIVPDGQSRGKVNSGRTACPVPTALNAPSTPRLGAASPFFKRPLNSTAIRSCNHTSRPKRG